MYMNKPRWGGEQGGGNEINSYILSTANTVGTKHKTKSITEMLGIENELDCLLR